MAKRGITPQTAEKFGIGCAPRNSEEMVRALGAKGFRKNELEEAGLLNARGGCLFFSRLMFPLRDKDGNTVAFSGRVMDDSKPKYINSPETPFFKKGEMLFNYSSARKTGKNFILCEGQMDVIAMVQAGFTSAVAPLGTAFTKQQQEMVGDNVTLCLDGDGPGTKKALQHAAKLYPKKVRIVHLPDGHDPDEILRAEGAEGLKKYMKGLSLPQMYAVVMKEKFEKPENPNVLRPKNSHADYSKRAEIVLDRSVDVALATIPVIRRYSLDKKADVNFLADVTGFAPKDIIAELDRANEKTK